MDSINGVWRLIVQLVRWLLGLLASLWRRASAPTIKVDTGIQVRLGRQIAEGGFSFVFEAVGVDGSTNAGRKYAVKRIHVGDREAVQACKREIGVHRALHHPNLMPLLGQCQEDTVVYMLFPFLPQSLRHIVNEKVFPKVDRPPLKPFEELKLLLLFHQVMSGVQKMHDTNFSHRDIKLENILLRDSRTPVLMDFGSAGPTLESIETRKEVLEAIEVASQHTTLPYRPPELLEGGIRAGDADLDYAKVDVWSLGCTLFAMMYGASPFECEFRRPQHQHHQIASAASTAEEGEIRVVECTQLRILGSPSMPQPNTNVGRWFSQDLLRIIQEMLTQDRSMRPSIEDVLNMVECQIGKLGGRLPKGSQAINDGDISNLFQASV